MSKFHFTKYDSSTEQVFTVMDSEQPCEECGKRTLTLFPAGGKQFCADCANRSIRSVRILK